MKRPSRSMIDGSAIALAVIAIIVLIFILLRRCDDGNKPETSSHAIGIEITTTGDSISSKAPRTNKKRGKPTKTKSREPKAIPERSPLDETVEKQ